MKKILAFALCTIVVLQLVVVSFAHDERSTVFHVKTCTDYKGRTCIGGEEFGFMSHMNQYAGHPTTFNLTYSFDLTQYTESDLVGPYDEKVHLDTMNDDIKAMFRRAAEQWNAVTVNGAKIINLREVASNADIIVKSTVSIHNNVASLATTEGKPDEAFHTRKWTIYLSMFKWLGGHVEDYGSLIFAHELGHVLGLADLTSDQNQDKVMYYALPQEGDLNNYSIKPEEIYGLTLMMNHNAHNLTDPAGSVCTECGLEVEHDFVSGSVINYSGNRYYLKCLSCDYKIWENHTANPNNGTKLSSHDNNKLTYHRTRCTDCRKTLLTFHSRGINSSVNGISPLYHLYSCSVCGQEGIQEAHSFDRMTNTCTFCQYQKKSDKWEINKVNPDSKE